VTIALRARKSLGQHFLLDTNLITRIVRETGDLTGRHIIEVGPGPGGLTRALLASPAASLTAIEIDPRAIPPLADLASETPRLRIIEADALTLDLSSLTPPPRQIVANLPYNVATPLLIAWLRQAAAYERLTLMFQQEVAERLCAAPSTPAYGRLSVLAQWTCQVALRLRIPPSAFVPPPKVFSAVVSFLPHAAQPPPDLFRAMEKVTAAAFGQRRKMLRGSLRSLGGQSLLHTVGIDAERRAETLTIEEFDRLARAARG
jgi:16S rRNA (adenine1518-N6/adenine1519-N6)-dimethyltransferase